jgi:hypothetical protein
MPDDIDINLYGPRPSAAERHNIKAALPRSPLGNQGEHLYENVSLPSGLHRAHVTNPHADPKIEDWQHLVPAGVNPSGIWAYTDSRGCHHLVITWKVPAIHLCL